jgi:hypothetical protein
MAPHRRKNWLLRHGSARVRNGTPQWDMLTYRTSVRLHFRHWSRLKSGDIKKLREASKIDLVYILKQVQQAHAAAKAEEAHEVFAAINCVWTFHTKRALEGGALC